MPSGGQYRPQLRATVVEKQDSVMAKSVGVGALTLALIPVLQSSHLCNEDNNY